MNRTSKSKYISPVFHENLQNTFEQIDHFLENQSYGEARELLISLHYADLAVYLENCSYKNMQEVIEVLGDEFNEESVVGLSNRSKSSIIEIIGIERFGALIDKLDSEEVIELMDDLSDDVKSDIITHLSDEKRVHIIEGFKYDEDTAGRIMEKSFIMIQDNWNIKQVLEAFKVRSLDSEFYAAIVVNQKMKPLGQVMLCNLLKYEDNTFVSEVMDTDLKIADTNTKLDEISYIFKQYALTIIPVVNKMGRLVGTISINNMIYIIEQQAEEEIMHLGGVSNHDIFDGLFITLKHRFPWLFINLLTAFGTSIIIAQFSSTIQQIVTLAAIMPIVASMGGNAGTQTMTVMVRSLHNKNLNYSNSFRTIMKELLVCGLNGIILALIGAIIVTMLFQNINLSIVFGAAVVINFLVAGFAGAFIPIFLERIDVDPAAASGVFLTTLTDILGFSTFLALAYIFLI
jgi:magnesium transporter